MDSGCLYSFDDRLNNLLERDNTDLKDLERMSFFNIVAGSPDLYSKVHHIYDFNEHSINPKCLESGKVDFSSTSQRLIKLAFNLYNSYPADVMDTFYSLDDKCFDIALNAIKIRFNKV